jgi:hypothetical protein
MNNIDTQSLNRILELILKQMRNNASLEELAELADLRDQIGFNFLMGENDKGTG